MGKAKKVNGVDPFDLSSVPDRIDWDGNIILAPDAEVWHDIVDTVIKPNFPDASRYAEQGSVYFLKWEALPSGRARGQFKVYGFNDQIGGFKVQVQGSGRSVVMNYASENELLVLQ